jgi:hypothetical protein
MRPLCLSLAAALAVPTLGLAADPVDYRRDVKPILQERCYACHGAIKQQAKLRLDSGAMMLKGGADGPVVVPGKPGESELLARVSSKDDEVRMPPEGHPLTDRQIAALRAWVEQGAKVPADDKAEPDPRDHWSFRPVARPAVPSIANRQSPIVNPVDAFITAQWQKRGLTPVAPADRCLLLRRVYLDLIGLPPTAEQYEAFLKDSSPDAYEKVVDQLLASPQYGERWGRHFLDIWRYSDWWGLGQELRNSQKHIWHWRDWVVESLNADIGYDEMVRQMLAADELYPTDPQKLRATGYLARPYFLFNRTTWLDEVIEHTGKGILGLTLNCSKCHDHKYDPVSQVNYYQFRAIFEPYQLRTDLVPGELDATKDGIPRAFDCNLDVKTYLHVRGDERNPDKNREITPGLPSFLAPDGLRIESEKLPALAYQPGARKEFAVAYHEKAMARAAAAKADFDRRFGKLMESVLTRLAVAELKVAAKCLAAAEVEWDLAQAHAEVAAMMTGRFCGSITSYFDARVEAAKAEKRIRVAQADLTLARAELDVAKATAAEKQQAEQRRKAAETALDAAKKAPEKRDLFAEAYLAEVEARASLRTAAAPFRRLAARMKVEAAQAAIKRLTPDPGPVYELLRGAVKTRESNVETPASLSRPFPDTSTGRRMALALWATDRTNPLTARVAVNHLWMRHFGAPLVPTIFDFGRKGTPPTHPELLDWLAVELMEHNWSLKHIHRLMVTSHVYRLSSSSLNASESVKVDPENRYLWRMNPVRMQSQVVRDSLLHLAGELDLTAGGPPVPLAEQDTSRRRAMYFFQSHNDHHKFLGIFDDANVLECYRRTESIVPQQGLALWNSKFALTMGGKINDRLHARLGTGDDVAFVKAAFETVLGTTPNDAEQRVCEESLTELREALKDVKEPDRSKRARLQLVQALINHNDFVTVR